MTEVLFDELTKDERAYDLARRKALWKADREDEMDWAMTEGRAIGFEKGLAEGLAEGRAEGLAEGRVEGRAEGLATGLQEGETKTSVLFQKLLEANRLDDLKKAASDKKYRDELFREFNL